MSASHARARLLMEQERWELAEREWRQVLAEEPDDAEPHAALALCLAGRERFDDAEREADAAVGLAPEQPFVHYVRARVLCDRNRFAAAAAAIAEAIRLAPEDADYRAMRASLHGRQQQWTECLAAADAGLACDAGHVGCANLRALALTQLGRKDEAAATIAGALERSPENSLSHTNQGWALLHGGEPLRALGHFREALRLDPANDWAREGLLTALKAQNRVYRVMLAFFLFMSRQTSGARWAIVIGILVGQQALRSLAHASPSWAWLAWVLLAAVMAFTMLTWLANPLMNLLMRLHPHGRHALTKAQNQQATLVGMCLVAASANLLVQYFNGGVTWLCLVLFVLPLPVSTVHTKEPGWPYRIAAVVAAIFACVALEITIAFQFAAPFMPGGARSGTEAGWLLIKALQIAVPAIDYYFWGILIWSFVSPQLAKVQPTR